MGLTKWTLSKKERQAGDETEDSAANLYSGVKAAEGSLHESETTISLLAGIVKWHGAGS